MSLFTAQLLQNSNILAETFFIVLKIRHTENLKSFHYQTRGPSLVVKAFQVFCMTYF